ncbi:MAG: hypothetical protein AUK53_01975 [Betaproteobacteria bacterium CG2_30_59_46]|nr:MAG: hypothetical protein AUK53_01975 [Betaproteobacteria bacterium CG2_30_59_46]PIQ12656.1 MAG: hypothetical protein COW70_08850 [Hydrogenophilales bacterium CG18_big_fil_WC_8_21_14_2_50_58_12]PIY01827.1 MAG: hypothetical protein COZ23_01160 [Hydrogenophilales bacterium CG_4_10_14_3_um_filter_58_23]PJB07422.1 MAG: hypothetical protein CO125_04915 [Hydrogenophilales bacterium CG_4_9_14_3_um_filter_59_35]
MSISDVMIHIHEDLDTEARSALEARMRDLDGVIAPRFNPGKEHLLLVAFDPDKAHPADLLGAVKTAGYTAQLVGV